MKEYYTKSILILILLLIVGTVKAQYKSIFGTNQTSWKYSYYTCLPCQEIDSSVVLYNFDTIIQNQTFKKIRPNTTDPTISDYYVSEDTTNGKVYYYNPNYIPNQIIKISDLSLTVGDTLKALGAIVDSVYFQNSIKYIRTNINSNGFNFTMIEGVGTNFGVNYEKMNLADGLLCQIKDSVINYTGNHPVLDCSSRPVSVLESDISDNISISPNPASGIVNIQTDNILISQVEFLDVKGRSIKLINNLNNEIDVSDLKSGIYFMRINTSKGLAIKKLMISK